MEILKPFKERLAGLANQVAPASSQEWNDYINLVRSREEARITVPEGAEVDDYCYGPGDNAVERGWLMVRGPWADLEKGYRIRRETNGEFTVIDRGFFPRSD